MRKFFGCLALCLGMLVGSAHADATRLYFGAGFSDGSVDISGCLLYTSPSPRDGLLSRMPSSS